MKKGLLILIVAALVLGLTSCSQDVYSKLGDMMGKMGNNVYGIKPNMAQVEAATQSLDSSVSSDGAGNVSVDLDKASQIISAVATIKDSSQKAEALKSELSKPIVSDSSEAIAVRDELQTTVGSIASSIPDVSSDPNLSDSQKELINDIKTAIGNVTISDNPTKAELATVAVLDALAQAAVDVSANAANLMDSNGLTEQGMAVAETALSSLDALKVVSEVANINVLGDLDLMSILGNLTGSRAISDEAKQYLDALNKTLLKVFGLISKNEAGNRVFDENNYKKFIAQAKAIRSSYELVAAPYLSSVSTFKQVDEHLLSMKIDHNLTIDDMLLYLLTAAFTEADGAAHDEIEALAVQFFSLGGYSALQNGADFDFSQLDTKLDNLQSALLISFTGSDSDDWEDVLAAVKEGGSKYMTGVKMVGTMTIMLVNSGYQSLLSKISDGTVSGLMK